MSRILSNVNRIFDYENFLEFERSIQKLVFILENKCLDKKFLDLKVGKGCGNWKYVFKLYVEKILFSASNCLKCLFGTLDYISSKNQ